ncbi:MAG: L-lactate dehydrogenase, partial [Eubacteriales bacterium]
MKHDKCAIIGTGFVGAACANALMQDILFEELILIDIDERRAQGEAMDISHG